MFVLSYVLPPEGGAKYGKATVLEPVAVKPRLIKPVARALREHNPHMPEAQAERYALQVVRKATGTESVESSTGLRFRIDPEDAAPNACPCCGRLVLFGDHAFAGSEDAYCLGCFTWGDRSKISCDPEHTAHANPWGTDTTGARYHMHVVFGDDEGETSYDDRYATDRPEGHRDWWDDEDNALIAWPGLTRDQLISVTITEINKED